jgi:hypothetical protein
LGTSTNYKAPYCAISSIFLLVHPSLVKILSSEHYSQTPSIYALPLQVSAKDHVLHLYKTTDNYGFVYFNLYIPEQQVGRQNTEPKCRKHSLNLVSYYSIRTCSFICWCCFQIFELRHIFNGPIRYLYAMHLTCFLM